jgi:isoquinoline 1-oxidoreductase beta subunit
MSTLDRRSFLRGIAASGLWLSFYRGGESAIAAPPPVSSTGWQANVYLHIATNGEVTVVCHRSEMGQGVRSTLHVMIADELGADPSRVQLVQADGDTAYGDQNTDGSTSIRKQHTMLRTAAATARTMLIEAAALRWKVPAAECTTKENAVFHTKSKKKLAFSDLVADAAKQKIPEKSTIKLRPREELTHVGTMLPLVDARAYVTGTALYAADIRVGSAEAPELIAVIARPPVVGGVVKKVDDSKARAVKGVVDVVTLPAPKGAPLFQMRGGVAVLAVNTWAALKGRDALSIEWDHGENASYDSTKAKENMRASVSAPGEVVREKGDAEKIFAATEKARIIESDYHVPFQAHASMEPPCAVARYHPSSAPRVEVWACTQNPQSARTEAAKTTGLTVEDVAVHVTFLGGGFGRKSKSDFVNEAVFLAKHTSDKNKAPAVVRVQWTREDDLMHDYYHAVSQQRLTAALDEKKQVIAWRHRTCFPPIPSTFTGAEMPSDGELRLGLLDMPLSIPNVRAERAKMKAQVRIGWLRAVCNIFHAFATSSFMDELSYARGLDPKENLLDILGPARIVSPDELGVKVKFDNYGQPLEEYPINTARHRAVVERVCELSNWSNRKSDPQGRGFGLAVHRSFLSYVAVVAAVSKKNNGSPLVDEVWIVTDAGDVMNLDRAHSQMEGAVIFGMTIAMTGAMTMKNGIPEQRSFRGYRLIRSTEAPRKTHVDFIKSNAAPGGIGEPGVPPVAPAIANAWFALTGIRSRDLPIGG